jgi:hypothetical protein
MNLIWQQNTTILKSGAVSNPLVLPVTFPAMTGPTQKLALSTSAVADGTFASLVNLQLYLQGDPDQLNTLLNVWPNYGSGTTPQQPELNGGIEISFDGGYSFTRLGALPDGTNLGFADDPTTWITVPASCIVPGTVDGVLGPFDLAMLSIRYIVPPLADQFQIFNVRLEAAFDVV